MEFKVPEKVQYIIDTLISNGFEAYAVGDVSRHDSWQESRG